MKAEHLSHTEIPDHPSAKRAAKRVRGVVKKCQAPTVCNFLELSIFARYSPEMDADDAGCAWCDQLLNSVRINVMTGTFHVAEHRSDLLPLKSMRRRDKRERRNDNFTFQIERPNDQLQGYSRVCD